ncbi:uncharacterized protein LOC127586044 isoform X2 [Pristis pectinata]|uniref:uncharacterized protein LOC127586044 isoform X2 n=1 Tax=Pristis pectinata TaxID=685728 RepID=UPI00223D06EA|nr:uncharacterized protein LOC127586044 isoform X2 [Pristis pectinata]
MAVYRWATVIAFFLISDVWSGTEANKYPVHQTPALLHVFEGDDLVLNCTFEFNGILTYNWQKDGCPIDFISGRYKNRVVLPDKNVFKTKKDASIQIKNVTLFDSGMYHCQLDVMSKGKYKGDGTLVIVRDICRKERQLEGIQFHWLWTGVAGGVVFLITVILLVVIAFLARRNKAYALLVRECTSFDSAKEPIAAPRRKMHDHANHQHEDAYLHCHSKGGAPKRKRPLPARPNME